MQTPATSLYEFNSELYVFDKTWTLLAQAEDSALSADIRKVSITVGDSPAPSRTNWKTVGDWKLIGCSNSLSPVLLTILASDCLIWTDGWILARARYRATPSSLQRDLTRHA